VASVPECPTGGTLEISSSNILLGGSSVRGRRRLIVTVTAWKRSNFIGIAVVVQRQARRRKLHRLFRRHFPNSPLAEGQVSAPNDTAKPPRLGLEIRHVLLFRPLGMAQVRPLEGNHRFHGWHGQEATGLPSVKSGKSVVKNPLKSAQPGGVRTARHPEYRKRMGGNSSPFHFCVFPCSPVNSGLNHFVVKSARRADRAPAQHPPFQFRGPR